MKDMTTDHRCTFYCCPYCHEDLRDLDIHKTPCKPPTNKKEKQ